MQFQSWGTCKHLAACLIHFEKIIFPISPEEKKLLISKQILNEFYMPKTNDIHLKKQLNLEVEIEFVESFYESYVFLNFKIILHSALNIFLSSSLKIYLY